MHEVDGPIRGALCLVGNTLSALRARLDPVRDCLQVSGVRLMALCRLGIVVRAPADERTGGDDIQRGSEYHGRYLDTAADPVIER